VQEQQPQQQQHVGEAAAAAAQQAAEPNSGHIGTAWAAEGSISITKLYTLQQAVGFMYYVMAALKNHKSDKPQQRAALLSIPDHIFNVDHSACGDWCHVKQGQHDHKPSRLGGKWMPPDKGFYDYLCGLVAQFAAAGLLDVLRVCLSTNANESFNNVVAACANKRKYLGRGGTWIGRLAAAALQHELGPTWTEVLLHEEFGVQSSNFVLEQLDRLAATFARDRQRRQSQLHRLHMAQVKARRTGTEWQNRTGRGSTVGSYLGWGNAISSMWAAAPSADTAQQPINPDEGQPELPEGVDEDDAAVDSEDEAEQQQQQVHPVQQPQPAAQHQQQMILGMLPTRLGPTAVPSAVAAVLDVQRFHVACTSAERLSYAGKF
jgi:hypothetical protein